MQQILQSLQNMIQMCTIIDASNVSQKIKDDSKRIFRESLDFVVKESSPETINKLVMEEMRVNYNKKIRENN